MDHIKEYFKKDALAAHLGIELLEVSPGRAVARMEVRDEHYNPFRTVHGGAIFTLADFAFAVAANSHGTIAVALSANILYLRPGGPGVLTAEAMEMSRGKTTATYDVKVANDAGKPVASFQGMVYRKGDPIPGSE